MITLHFHVYFCKQSRMQMSKNVDNDVSMNPPIKLYVTPHRQ